MPLNIKDPDKDRDHRDKISKEMRTFMVYTNTKLSQFVLNIYVWTTLKWGIWVISKFDNESRLREENIGLDCKSFRPSLSR